MKKLIIGFALLLGVIGSSFAQSPKTSTTPATKTPAAKTTAAKPATSNGVVLKKDGTPDKRYKSTAPAGPVKKDGTPDKRYKANKKG